MLPAFISDLLQKKLPQNNVATAEVDKKKSWYVDRYQVLETQRNILFIFLICTIASVIVTVLAIGKISISKTVSPFVIEIEERTGAAKIVTPVGSSLLSANDSITRYFIKKYLIARATYNPVDFETNAKKVVRLLSSTAVYRDYLGYIRNPLTDPSQVYGQRNTTTLKIKSFQKLRDQYFVRFSVIEASGARKVIDQIATITADYLPMELTDEERDINPVGFQITGYRVDDDQS